MPTPLPWVALATAALVLAHAPMHPALDGGPVLGQPRARVQAVLKDNGWTFEAGRSTKAKALFGHADAHLEVAIAFDASGVARGAHVRPWLDETSAAFLHTHYGALVAWLGGPRAKVRKQLADGELQGVDVAR